MRQQELVRDQLLKATSGLDGDAIDDGSNGGISDNRKSVKNDVRGKRDGAFEFIFEAHAPKVRYTDFVFY